MSSEERLSTIDFTGKIRPDFRERFDRIKGLIASGDQKLGEKETTATAAFQAYAEILGAEGHYVPDGEITRIVAGPYIEESAIDVALYTVFTDNVRWDSQVVATASERASDVSFATFNLLRLSLQYLKPSEFNKILEKYPDPEKWIDFPFPEKS